MFLLRSIRVGPERDPEEGAERQDGGTGPGGSSGPLRCPCQEPGVCCGQERWSWSVVLPARPGISYGGLCSLI